MKLNIKVEIIGCHDLPERTETDFSGYRNGPEQTLAHTQMNLSGNQKR